MNYWYIVIPFVFGWLIGKPYIAFLHRLKSLQSFRELGPQSHIENKSGTPTMGAWIFLLPILLSSIFIYLQEQSQAVLLVSLALFVGATMGMIDDMIKIFQANYRGLDSKQKLLIQIIASSVICFFSGRYLFADLNSWLPSSLGPILIAFEFIWAFLVIAGSSNAINLTDGLDGLATTLSIIAFGAIAYYLWISGDIALFNWVLVVISSLAAFLCFNFYPAKVFMGDTGSLALGMALGALAYISNIEWYLVVFALVPVLETISVILQVLSAKLSRRYLGRDIRLFKMAPLHHHFELCGLHEVAILMIFSTVQLIVSAVFIAFKLVH